MDDRVARLTTPNECEQFARNVEKAQPELAQAARRRAVELRADARAMALGLNDPVELEALQAIYAYEEVLSKKNGRRTSAGRTWPMVKQHGIIRAVERAVNRRTDASGYLALAEMKMQDITFEAVVLRHPRRFSAEAVRRSAERLKNWQQASAQATKECPCQCTCRKWSREIQDGSARPLAKSLLRNWLHDKRCNQGIAHQTLARFNRHRTLGPLERSAASP